jgi:2-methylisocitrate lyase-like PEP mutase family enzyme
MTDFRALHRPGDPFLLPNAWDVASARALAGAGFAAIGTTSLGVAAAHGYRDGQGHGRDETLALVRRLAGLPALLTVDVEGGFGGDPAEVASLAADLAAAGAVGLNLEDGRAGGELAPIAEQTALITAIKAAAPSLFLNARTDTFWLGQGGLTATQNRLLAYAEAGADGVFVPGITDPDDIRSVTERSGLPVNVLLLPGLTVPGLAELGVARVSTGSLLFRAALDATVRTALSLWRGAPVPGGLPSYADVNVD